MSGIELEIWKWDEKVRSNTGCNEREQSGREKGSGECRGRFE